MDKRYKDVRQIFDFATSLADELLSEHPHMTAEEIVELSTEIAIHNSGIVIETELPVAEVDKKNVQFMIDEEVAVDIWREDDNED